MPSAVSILPPGGGFLLSAVIGFALWIGAADEPALGPVSLLASLGAAITFTFQRRSDNGRFVLEPALLLVWAMGVWHFAFWVVFYLGVASDFRVTAYFATAPDARFEAMIGASLAIMALAGGLRFGLAAEPVRGRVTSEDPRARNWTRLAALGSLLSITFLVIGGRDLIGAYSDVFLAEDPLRRLYNLGAFLALTSLAPAIYVARSRQEVVGAILAALPAMAASLLLGTRWIFFTAIALTFMAMSMRGAKLKPLWVLLAIVTLVGVGTVIKEVRSGNVTTAAEIPAAFQDRSSNPVLELPEELGQTHIPTAAEIDRRRNGVSPEFGRSFLQAVVSVVPSMTRLFYATDDRPPERIAQDYFGERYAAEGFTSGYSLVAELYLNFDKPGVFIGFLLLGLVSGYGLRYALRSPGSLPIALSFAITAILIFGLRNDVTSWFRYAVWITVIVAIVWWVGQKRAERTAAVTPASVSDMRRRTTRLSP